MYPGVRTDCYALQTKICDFTPAPSGSLLKDSRGDQTSQILRFHQNNGISHALRVFPVTFSTKPLYAETGKASNIPLCQSYKSYINIRPSFSQDRLYLSKIKLNQCPPTYPQILRIPLPVLHHRRLWLNDPPQYEHKSGANASQYGDIGTDCVSAWHGTIHRI